MAEINFPTSLNEGNVEMNEMNKKPTSIRPPKAETKFNEIQLSGHSKQNEETRKIKTNKKTSRNGENETNILK